jgi:hypothetical protein
VPRSAPRRPTLPVLADPRRAVLSVAQPRARRGSGRCPPSRGTASTPREGGLGGVRLRRPRLDPIDPPDPRDRHDRRPRARQLDRPLQDPDQRGGCRREVARDRRAGRPPRRARGRPGVARRPIVRSAGRRSARRMTSAAARRLARLEGALPPREAVLAWLVEANSSRVWRTMPARSPSSRSRRHRSA